MRASGIRLAICGWLVAAAWQGHAGTYTWDAGGVGDTNWSTGVNWTNAASDNTVPSATDDAVFSLTGTRVVGIGAGGDQSISNVVVSSSGNWTWRSNATPDSLVMSGQFAYQGSGNSYLYAPVGGSGSLLVGAGGLVVEVPTNVHNTYAGGTTVTGGILAVSGVVPDNSLLGTGPLVLRGGRITAIYGHRTVTNAVVLDGNAGFGAQTHGQTVGRALTFLGNVSLTGNRIVTTASGGNGSFPARFEGVIDDGPGSFSLTHAGAALLTLANTNTFDGGLTGTGGDLNIGSDRSLGGGTLTLMNCRFGSSFGNQTITNQLTLNGTVTFAFSGSGHRSYWFDGPVRLDGHTTISGDVDGNNSGTTEFRGAIGDEGNGYRLTKTGANRRITLSAANTFLGGLTVTAGPLRIGNVNSCTGTAVAAGGTFEVGTNDCLGVGTLVLGYTSGYSGIGAVGADRSVSNTILFSGNLYLGGDASGTAIDSTARILTLSGASTVDTATRLILNSPSSRETRLTGPLGGLYSYSSGVAKLGAGTLILTGDNTLKSGIRMDAGTLRLLGNNTGLAGGLTVNGGTLWGKARASGNAWGSNALVLNPGGVISHDGLESTDTDTAMGNVTFSGSGTLGVLNPTPGNMTTLSISRLERLNRGVLVVRGITGTTSANLGGSERIMVSDPPASSNGMVAPYLLKPAANAYVDFVNHTMAGGFTQVAYSASTDINTAGGASLFTAAGAQTLTGDREVYAAQVQQLGSVNHAGYTLTLGSGGLIHWVGSSGRTYSGNLRFGGQGDREGHVYAGDGAGALTVSGSLTTANGLTKSGPSPLYLSGDNRTTLAGPITLNAGSIRLDSADALPDGLPLTVNAGTFNLNGNDKVLAGLVMGGGTVNNTAAQPVTLTLTGDVAYAASGSGATIASAAGQLLSLDLNGARTFDVEDGAAGDDLTVTAPLLGDAGYTKKGSGMLYLNATNASTLTGSILIRGGMLRGATFAGNNPFGAVESPIVLDHDGKIRLDGGNTSTNGVVTFSGGNVLLARNGQSGISWRLAGLARAVGSRGTLQGSGDWTSSNGNDYFDVNNSLFVTNWAVIDRMPAWFVHTLNATYNNQAFHVRSDTGGRFRSVNYATVDINASTAATLFNATTNQVMSAHRSCYYLRTSADIDSAGAYMLTVAGAEGNEAGIIFNGNNTISPSLTFGATGEREGLVFVRWACTGRLTGTVTTSGGLTKFGAGTLALAGSNGGTLSGPVTINEGWLRMDSAQSLAMASPIVIGRGAALVLSGSYTLGNAISGLGSILADTNTVTLDASSSLTPGFAGECGALTVEDLDFQGTLNWEYDGTTNDVVACRTLTFGGGAVALNVQWIGSGAAAAARGAYTLFTYQGADPVLPDWTVTMSPVTEAGAVTLDSANKRVLLTIIKRPNRSVFRMR